MNLKKFNQFISEGLGDDNIDKFQEYESLKQDLLNMIENSVNSNDMSLVNEFIDSFISDSESTNVEGLVNDSDVYEFYLKYINEIDEILDNIEFFSRTPESEGALGLYDFLVKGTRNALIELFKMIKNDLGGEDNQQELEDNTI